MDDILSLLFDFVPIGIVAFVYATTAICRTVFIRRDGLIPSGFILLPLILGLISGAVHYFVVVDLETFHTVPKWRHTVTAIELALGYAGASVLIWEIRKHFWPLPDPKRKSKKKP